MLFYKEECYLNNQFGDNLFDNHTLQFTKKKNGIGTETIAIER